METRKRKQCEESYDNLSLENVMCPVCMSILIEPVSLPCNRHTLCFDCFDKTIEHNTLTCPICRKRIGSWLRSKNKTRSLINTKLWEEIQKRFPNQVKSKQAGEDDGVEEAVITANAPRSKRICTPGEIRVEFEDQLKKLNDEIDRKKEQEEQASKEFIDQLLKIEIQELEKKKRDLEQLMQEDENLARSLQPTPSTIISQLTSKVNSVKKIPKVTKTVNSKKNRKNVQKPTLLINSFFDIKTSHSRSTPQSSPIISGENRNSIDAEFSHFKPITKEPQTPPKIMSDGKIFDSKPLKINPLNLDLSGKYNLSSTNLSGPKSLNSSEGPKAFSPIKRVPVLSTSNDLNKNDFKDDDLDKNDFKYDDSDTDFEDDCTPAVSIDPSNITVSHVEEPLICSSTIEMQRILEKEIYLRLQQEEEDRKFAEYLQKVWETEKKQELKSDYHLRSRPSTSHSSTNAVPSVGRQTTLDNHIVPLKM